MLSVIIPAHNERSVITRALRAILCGAVPGELEVIVVCNGCSDDTAAVARAFDPGVRVLETPIAGKTHALNLGDAAAKVFPRFYIDADVLITLKALRIIAQRLETGRVLAAAPLAHYNLSGLSWFARAFFEVRALLPSSREGIGGSGVYALSQAGRRRFAAFPEVIADDGFVRIQFEPHERETISEAESTVFPPRCIRNLIATKARAHYGSFELARLHPEMWNRRGRTNNKALRCLFAQPHLWVKLIVYCFVTVQARRQAMRRLGNGSMKWERDNTSRGVGSSRLISER